MQPRHHDGEEPEIAWREAVEPWLKTLEEWREGPAFPLEFDDERRAELAFAFLEAALEAEASKDEDAQSRYITEAESLVQTIGQVEDSTLLWGLGDSLRRIGRPADAVEYLLRAVNLSAGSTADEEALAQLHSELHYCYDDLHQYDFAEHWEDKWAEWAERATRPGGGHEGNARLHFRLGGYYFDRGKYELAAEGLESAERSGLEAGALCVARQERAYALQMIGRWEGAIPIWKELEEQEEDRQFAAHFAEMLGYARGRLDARLRRRHAPGCPEIVLPGEAEERLRRVVPADISHRELQETFTRESQQTRLGLVRFEQEQELLRVRVEDMYRKFARRPDERLGDIERELQETYFGETWTRLRASTRRCLCTAEEQYRQYVAVERAELSNIGMEFATTLEIELKTLVLEPFRDWLRAADVPQIQVRNEIYRTADLDRLTLGKIKHLLLCGDQDKSPEIRRWVQQTAPGAETFLLKQLPLRLSRIVRWRNRAHDASLEAGELAKLRSEILGSPEDPGLLKQLVDAMTAKDPEQ